MIYDANNDEVHGLFIPADSVSVVLGKSKRRDHFLCVYLEALNLKPQLYWALSKLAEVADPYNKVCYSWPELIDKAQLAKSKPTLYRKLAELKAADALRGTPPFLLLNPFLISKCDAKLLAELRTKWFMSSLKGNNNDRNDRLEPDTGFTDWI